MPKKKNRFSVAEPTDSGLDLAVSPDPIPNADPSITISGSGFPPGPVAYGVSGGSLWGAAEADADGNFSGEYAQPGDYGLWKEPMYDPRDGEPINDQLGVWAYGHDGQGKNTTPMFTETFTVDFG